MKKVLKREIKVTLAFEPSVSFLDEIREIAARDFGGDVELRHFVDRALVGGAIVEFEGRYWDGSVAKDLNKFFEKTTNDK